MALNKLQNIINKLSHDPKIKKVISEVQATTKDIQGKIQNINTDDAVKKYKELVKIASAKEKELQKEVNTIITKVKKSALEVEKNLKTYKKKAEAERAKIEKTMKAKMAAQAPKDGAKKASKAKKAVKK